MSKVVGGVIGFLAGGWLLIMVMSAMFALFTDGGTERGTFGSSFALRFFYWEAQWEQQSGQSWLAE